MGFRVPWRGGVEKARSDQDGGKGGRLGIKGPKKGLGEDREGRGPDRREGAGRGRGLGKGPRGELACQTWGGT